MSKSPHRTNRIESVTCAILTVSDTRTCETDLSGRWLKERLAAAGHQVVAYEILPDEPGRVRDRVIDLAAHDACQAILLTGGTGLTSRDTTYEAVAALLEKRLDGFGELFRMLSYERVGAAAMLSRAVAGTIRQTCLFSVPGSPAAVELAVDKLILPQLGHIAWLLGR